MTITEPERLPETIDEMRQKLWTERLDGLARKWKERLGLGAWDITYVLSDVVNDCPRTEGHVRVDTILGHEAEITIAERVLWYEPSYREKVLVHEMAHILLDEVGMYALHYLPEETQTYFTRLIEIFVSDLTNVLVALAEEGKAANAEPEG